MHIVGADQRQCLAAVLCARCTPDTMHVVFRRMRHIVIDDQRHISHINTSRDDVCRHQHTYLTVLEIQHNLVAFILLKVAMHRARVYM